MDVNDLQLQVDGVSRTFAEWTEDYVSSYFPRVGQECYCVPSLHFNQQKLSRRDTLDYSLLHPPDPSISEGDLAHTVVLEKMKELSHQLWTRDRKPFFIISSVDYDNYLARLQPPKKRRRRKGQKGCEGSSARICASVKEDHQGSRHTCCSADSDLDKKSGGENTCPEKRLPPRPADKGGQRGELDIMILHETGGVVMIEVKSTGINANRREVSETEQQAAIQTCVTKARAQLDKGREVLNFIMPDLSFHHVTVIIALPYVTRQQLDRALSNEEVTTQHLFLCKDELFPCPPGQTGTKQNSGCNEYNNTFSSSSLLPWWDKVQSINEEGLSLENMKTIVGRICGLLSIVSVWTLNKPRVEVRTQSQAISEAGRRISDIVLLPSQASILADNSLTHICLSGPMGSGKTLLLQLKGRQWMNEGRRVIVVNVRTMGRGRPTGHILEESIRRGAQVHQVSGSVERHDIALDEFDMDTFQTYLAKGGPMNNACFLLDEVMSDMSDFVQQLTDLCPHCPIWCVVTYATARPRNFEYIKLGAVLRSPPSVQLLLKELDLNPRHKNAYTTRSSTQGLPCDGPPILFIHHSKHNTDIRHLDCPQCAHELADNLEKLGIQLQSKESKFSSSAKLESASTTVSSESASKQSTDVAESSPNSSPTMTEMNSRVLEATPLSFRDILILVSPSATCFEQVAPGHWEPSLDDVFRFLMYLGSSKFFATLRQRGLLFKAVIDDTRSEIAMPTTDTAILCDLQSVYSLERKVVIFIGGGPPLTEKEVATHLSRYHLMIPGDREASDHALLTKAEFLPQSSSPPKELDSDKFGNMRLFLSLFNNQQRALCPEISTSSKVQDDESILQTILGDMFVAGTQSFIKGAECCRRWKTRAIPKRQLSEEQLHLLRMGMEVRGDVPACRSSRSDTESNVSTSQAPCGYDFTSEGDSAFLVPDVDDDIKMRQTEMQRIQEAMASLSMDDQDMQFVAVSRCLSQYITILP